MRPLSTQLIAILGLLLTSTAIAAETSKPSGPKTIDPPKFRSLYRASQNSLKPLDCPQTFTSIFELREQHLQQAKQALQDILPPHHTTAFDQDLAIGFIQFEFHTHEGGTHRAKFVRCWQVHETRRT